MSKIKLRKALLLFLLMVFQVEAMRGQEARQESVVCLSVVYNINRTLTDEERAAVAVSQHLLAANFENSLLANDLEVMLAANSFVVTKRFRINSGPEVRLHDPISPDDLHSREMGDVFARFTGRGQGLVVEHVRRTFVLADSIEAGLAVVMSRMQRNNMPSCIEEIIESSISRYHSVYMCVDLDCWVPAVVPFGATSVASSYSVPSFDGALYLRAMCCINRFVCQERHNTMLSATDSFVDALGDIFRRRSISSVDVRGDILCSDNAFDLVSPYSESLQARRSEVREDRHISPNDDLTSIVFSCLPSVINSIDAILNGSTGDQLITIFLRLDANTA